MLILAVSILTGCSAAMEQNHTTIQDGGTVQSDSAAQDESTVRDGGTKQKSDTKQQDIESGDEDDPVLRGTEEDSWYGGTEASVSETAVRRDGEYTSKDEVAAYLYQYGSLPDNYITKKQAKKLGWVSSEGNLHEVAPGKSIGGDFFGNYEGALPEKEGREYHECDIDTDGGYRGAKRIIYSNDGLIYYTEDHYDTFELLYGEE